MSLRHLASVLFAVFVLMAGNGLLSTLLPISGAAAGYSPEAIGLIGASYFLGMLLGTWSAPAIVARSGHIRAFAAYAAIAAVATLAMPIFVSPITWMLCRGLVGFCFAGLFSVSDSWINDKATNANRGRMLAMSNVVNFSGSALGQQILRLDEPRAPALFSAVAGLFMLSLLPMTMTTADPPSVPKRGKLEIKALYLLSPVGAVAMVLVGFVNGTFWSLAALYIERLNLGTLVVSNFMTAMILGSAIGPYPIALLSDRMDRRVVIIATAAGAALCEIGLILAGARIELLYPIAFCLGLALPVLYPLVAAHTNDRMGKQGSLMIASTLLFLYCVGAISGPVIAATLMTRFGDVMLFIYCASVHAAIIAFVLWRMLKRVAPIERVEVDKVIADEVAGRRAAP